uniref:Putative secreted protein n=1 Tax=Xenopsylla cheopis TaxID=163159 RepID=A0A6M2DZM2_XENCH
MKPTRASFALRLHSILMPLLPGTSLPIGRFHRFQFNRSIPHKLGHWIRWGTRDFLDVTMIALQKKPQAKKCSDDRIISLLSHTGKVMARILNRKL